MRFAASYYDGIVARPQPAAIVVTDAGITIFAVHGPMLAHWSAERVVLAEPPRDGEPVRIGLDGTTARLVVGGPAVVEALEGVAPLLYRRVRLSWQGLARIEGWAGRSSVTDRSSGSRSPDAATPPSRTTSGVSRGTTHA